MSYKFLLLAIIVGLFYVDIAKSATPSVSLRMSTPQQTVKAGSEVPLRLEVTNLSNHEIRLLVDKSMKAELNQYQFNVIRSDHQPVLIMKYYWELTKEAAPKENVKDFDKVIIIVSDSGSMPLSLSLPV